MTSVATLAVATAAASIIYGDNQQCSGKGRHDNEGGKGVGLLLNLQNRPQEQNQSFDGDCCK